MDSIFPRKFWRPLLVIIGASFFQQMTGINPLLTNINQISGDQKHWPIYPALAQVGGNIIGAIAEVFTEFLGRRAIWFIAMFFISITLMIYAIILSCHRQDMKELVLVDIFIYLLLFGFGAGPIPWFLPPEFFPVKKREIGGSIGAVMNWLFAFAAMQASGSIGDGLNGRGYVYFYIFGAFSLGGAAFGYFYIRNPEGQAREELHKNIYDALPG
jgi:hypothetical protein